MPRLPPVAVIVKARCIRIRLPRRPLRYSIHSRISLRISGNELTITNGKN
jgi:hypothetical protein